MRTVVPLWERVVGTVVVCLLAGIAAAIWWKGSHYDPSLYQPDPAKLAGATESLDLPDTAPPDSNPPMAPADGGENGITSGYTEASTHEPAGASAAPGRMPPLAIPGFRPSASAERYDAESLYEKINGRAPAYLEFGFRQLTCMTFPAGSGESDYVDLYAYEMADPKAAYGIYALEKDPDGKALDFVPDGYESGTGFFFRQGNHYVQALASSDASAATARELAVAVAKALPSDDTGLGELKSLPREGMVAGSEEFFDENAYGLAFLKNVSHARYQGAFGEVTYFVAAGADAEDAAAMEQAYLGFCGKHGRILETDEIGGITVTFVEVLGKSRAFYRKGNRFGGVQQAGDPAAAKLFLSQVLPGHP